MAGVGRNSYPPIVATSMPSFVKTQACRVYFSLSAYNDIADFDQQKVQVIVSYQNNNQSALDETMYPTGVKLTALQVDDSRSDDKYFITIEPRDLAAGQFRLNQYYKVQLRLTGLGASRGGTGASAKWLSDNQKFFSEWSTVVLIKGISTPSIYLHGFEESNANTAIVLTNQINELVGDIEFEDEYEREHVKSYRIQIRNLHNYEFVYDSGDIYTNVYNPNEINCQIKTNLEDGIDYQLIFTYITNNGYEGTSAFLFSIVQNTLDTLKANILAEVDNELGRVKVNVVSSTSEVFFGHLVIRRTSSESNFKIWEDVNKQTITNGQSLDYVFYDYTVKSGIWYRYAAQKVNTQGTRTAAVISPAPIMPIFEDIFLTRADMQLRVRFNPDISAFTPKVLESKTETLGGKYAVTRRNGDVSYKQFPISGLITAFCDEEGLFLNKENIYGDSVLLYKNYNDLNNITEYDDVIYERAFREKVMEFLEANDVKLFRSSTEGNFLVRLTGISYSPLKTLGRRLFAFTATAYEVDACNLDNYIKYGIQRVGEFDKLLQYSFDKIGQVRGTFSTSKQNIYEIIKNKYLDQSTETYINDLDILKWVRITFESAPYTIRTSNSGIPEPAVAADRVDENTYNGYIVYINAQPIVVSPRGVYELIDPDTAINSIYFPIATEATIDYLAGVRQNENTNKLYRRTSFFTKVGQIVDDFKWQENIFLKIYQKYLLDYTTYHQQLITINKVMVETMPGAVLYVRDSFDDMAYRHEVGFTGTLELYDPDTTISGLYFEGIQLYAAVGTYIRENEFKEIAGEPLNPQEREVYVIDGQRKIYYNAAWYDFTDDNIVKCPVHAQIDYIYESLKGEY